MRTFYTINTPNQENKEFSEKQLYKLYEHAEKIGLLNKEKYSDFKTWLKIMMENEKIEYWELPETSDEWMQYNGVSWSDFI